MYYGIVRTRVRLKNCEIVALDVKKGHLMHDRQVIENDDGFDIAVEVIDPAFVIPMKLVLKIG